MMLVMLWPWYIEDAIVKGLGQWKHLKGFSFPSKNTFQYLVEQHWKDIFLFKGPFSPFPHLSIILTRQSEEKIKIAVREQHSYLWQVQVEQQLLWSLENPGMNGSNELHLSIYSQNLSECFGWWSYLVYNNTKLKTKYCTLSKVTRFWMKCSF